MADPFTISLAVAGVTGALGAVSSIAQGQAGSRAAKFESRQLDERARVDRMIAARNEVSQRRDSRRQLSRQRAAIAQSGGGFGGSALDIMGQSAVEAELDALNVRFQGEAAAVGAENQASAARFRGRQSRRRGGFGAATSLIGAFSTGAASFAARPRV